MPSSHLILCHPLLLLPPPTLQIKKNKTINAKLIPVAVINA